LVATSSVIAVFVADVAEVALVAVVADEALPVMLMLQVPDAPVPVSAGAKLL
jgi:hypothetical protein